MISRGERSDSSYDGVGVGEAAKGMGEVEEPLWKGAGCCASDVFVYVFRC